MQTPVKTNKYRKHNKISVTNTNICENTQHPNIKYKYLRQYKYLLNNTKDNFKNWFGGVGQGFGGPEL